MELVAVVEMEAKLPEPMRYCWQIFLRLCATRASGMGGPAAISFSEIDAFQRVMRIALPSWIIEGLFRLDSAFFEHHAKGDK